MKIKLPGKINWHSLNSPTWNCVNGELADAWVVVDVSSSIPNGVKFVVFTCSPGAGVAFALGVRRRGDTNQPILTNAGWSTDQRFAGIAQPDYAGYIEVWVKASSTFVLMAVGYAK